MGLYKYKLKEVEDKLTIKDKEKLKVGDNTISKGVKYVVTDIDKETGRVEWDVNYLPNLEELFEIATELAKISKGVYVKAKNDPKFREIYEESSNLRNKIRTHIRNEYPEDYKRIVTNIDEMSTTGGGIGAASFTPGTGAQYATPFAFKKSIIKKEKGVKEGYYGNNDIEEFDELRDEAEAAGLILAESTINEAKKQKFVLYTNPNNSTDRGYVVIGTADVREILSDAKKYSDSYKILYQGTGTQDDLVKAKNMFSDYRFGEESIDETVELVHVYDTKGELQGTGELVKTRANKSLIRWDGSSEEWIDSKLVKLVEGMISPKMANGFKIGNKIKTQKGTYTITGFGSKTGATRDFEAENEDIDLGHEDNEPHMIKGELYRIGKYAMELYQMMDSVEGMGEVDLPAWWQSKITTAKNMISGAKHYLEFELKEPAVDAAVDALTGEESLMIEDKTNNSQSVKSSSYNPGQFAYKLVPKKIKGSGIIVKQLFEKEEEEKKNFQLKRIEAFKGVEEKLNNIYAMISNAKNETIKYYKENPNSYVVIKPTDLITDYLEDIEKLLKNK